MRKYFPLHRCLYCNWCIGFCYNSGKSTKQSEHGSIEVPYKTPILDVFRDLEGLVQGNQISELDVVNLYKSTSEATLEDCRICNNQPDLEQLSIFMERVYMDLHKMMGEKNFKTTAIEKTRETYDQTQRVPSSITTLVEETSSIMDSVNSGKFYASF